MNATLRRRFEFQAAHQLPKVPPDHKCGRLHGHSFVVEVIVAGTVRDDGMVLDFAEVDAVVAPLVARLEHRFLNDVEGLENPTSELLAAWFLARVPIANAIVVHETAKSSVTVTREERF